MKTKNAKPNENKKLEVGNETTNTLKSTKNDKCEKHKRS